MKKSIAVLKNYFKTGDKPTQQQFYDFLESFLHLDSYILASQVTGLETALAKLEALGISDVVGLQTALNDLNTAITTLEIADVSGLQPILDALAVVTIGDVVGLQDALNSLANIAIEDVTGLTEALNEKASIENMNLLINEVSLTNSLLFANTLNTSEKAQKKVGGLILGDNLTFLNDKWLTFGTSVTNSAVYSTPTAKMLNLTLMNYGVSGSTSNDLVNHFSEIPTLTDANKNEYRLLSIEHSINDASQSVNINTFRTNIINFINNAKSKNWPNNKILLINCNFCTTEPLATNLTAYANKVKEIAEETGVQFFDAYNYTLYYKTATFLTDGVHPSNEGGLVYSRGLIANMQGGMEITNALTIRNGLTLGGVVLADKKITTLESIETGGGVNNTPANTIKGDVLVPVNAGMITQYSQTGIISKITVLEDFGDGDFGVSLRNFTENSTIRMYVAGTVRGAQNLALKVLSNKDVNFYGNLISPENINLGFGKLLQYVGAYVNKIAVSDGSGSIVFNNGYASGEVNFNVSNGVTNASVLALKIYPNKDVAVYGNLISNENINIGFNKLLQYVGAYVNKIAVSDGSGSIVFSSGYATGEIKFNVSNGVTNASNLALQILNNKDAKFYGNLISQENINIGNNKNIQYTGAFDSKIVIADGGTFATSIYNGYATGVINFYTSNGVTNASNLALQILNNGNLSIVKKAVLVQAPDTSSGSYDVLTRNTSTGLVEKVSSSLLPSSGSYTPTLTNSANLTASALINAVYTKIGNIVTVTVGFTVTPTTANINAVLTLSLPIPRTASTILNVGNGAIADNAIHLSTVLQTKTNTTEVGVYFYPSSTNTYAGSATFMYEV